MTQYSVLTLLVRVLWGNCNGGGGGSGVTTPPPPPNTHLQYAVLLYCLVCKCYIAMSMVVVLVSSKQVVKLHSRLAMVKPAVLHLFECYLIMIIKMGVCFIMWAWLSIFFHILMSQPHLSRSTPAKRRGHPGKQHIVYFQI